MNKVLHYLEAISTTKCSKCSLRDLTLNLETLIATFRLEYEDETLIATFRLEHEDDYYFEFTVLSTRFRLAGRKFSNCACSEL